MTEFGVDLDAYFARIGYDGPRAPTLDTLKKIVLSQQMSIAFENLSSFSGLAVPLDPALIEQKIIRDGRGGYCYEQNRYLGMVLAALGFDVRLRMARIRWMQPPGAVTQRGHKVLNVAAEGQWYLCDVAFGAMTPTAPLLLSTLADQLTPHQTYRVVPEGRVLNIDVKLGENWRPVYGFDDLDQYPVDFEAVNWQVSTHPKSEFVNNLIVARPTADRRQILNNATLSIRHRDGAVEKSLLAGSDELRAALTTTFGIALPDNSRIDRALEGLFERAS